VDYKALVGDKSDNIPGVSGIGEKTAIALIQKFGTLDNIYTHLDEVENRWKNKLEQNKDKAYLSYDLAKIKTDVNVKLDLQHAKADELDFDSIEKLFTELEFRSLLKILDRLSGKAITTPTLATATAGQQLSMFEVPQELPPIHAPKVESNLTVHIVDTPEKLADLVNMLNNADVISFDTETTSTEEMRAKLVGISLAVKEGEGYYIPVAHREGYCPH
jgi:DNA polymerase-1